VIVLALTGCGVRLDTPPPALPSPGADETARQGAAERATAVAALAQEAATDAAGADVAVLDRIASDARAHADALGGVWAPPDWATTAGMPTPTPSPTSGPGETAPPVAPTSTAQPAPADPSDRTGPPAAPGAADVARALAASAERTCADAVAVEPADLASLLASICLAQRRGATALGDAVPDLAGTPGAEERAAALAAADLDALALSRALDAAGFALEVAAARSAGATRDDLVERAEDHRTTAELLLEAAGVLSTDEDPRRAAYDLEDGRAEPADVESGVLAAWSAAFGARGDVPRPALTAPPVVQPRGARPHSSSSSARTASSA
jgi:hypothetical protein